MHELKHACICARTEGAFEIGCIDMCPLGGSNFLGLLMEGQHMSGANDVSLLLSSADLLEYGDYEDHHDTSVTQMLVPRSHQEDATLVLNNLLREYDKTLRPDIGGESGSSWCV